MTHTSSQDLVKYLKEESFWELENFLSLMRIPLLFGNSAPMKRQTVPENAFLLTLIEINFFYSFQPARRCTVSI